MSGGLLNKFLSRLAIILVVLAGLIALPANEPADAAVGSGSISLNGTNQNLSVASNAVWNIGTGDFTVEWFQNQTSAGNWPRVFSFGTYPAPFAISIEGGDMYVWTAGYYTQVPLGGDSNYLNKWVHFAVVRSASVLSVYMDGVRILNQNNTANIQTGSNPMLIGTEGGTGTYFAGKISNFHYANGTAAYSGASFTRPTANLGGNSSTKLLLRATSADNLLIDSSGSARHATNVGGATWSSDEPFTAPIITTPGAPTLNSATPTPGGAQLSFTAPASNGGSPITSYEYSVNSTAWVNTGSTSTTIDLIYLYPGGGYDAKVRAVNSAGAGPASATLSFIPNKNLQQVYWTPTTSSGYVSDGSFAAGQAAWGVASYDITYTVQSAGTTGCTFNSGTLVVSYTAAGTCVIRATAASTATYESGYLDYNFVISKRNQTITWAPTTSISTTQSPLTPSASATALGGLAVTYSVQSAGTTGCTVNSSTGVLTYSAAGSCTVRASTVSNGSYNAGLLDKVFTITAPVIYNITYDYNNATGAMSQASDSFTVGNAALTLPSPSRTSYVFNGWYDALTGGNKVGDAGANYSPTATRTLYARWTQLSLSGIGSNTKIGTITTVNGVGNTYSATSGSTGVQLSYLANALPAGTVIDIYLLADTNRATSLITETNSFVINLLVAWKASDESVPTTASGKPITLTITNPAIKRGQKIYALLGGTVTELGVATQDGSAVVEITEDPEIVFANTKPSAPTGVTGSASGTSVTVSWTAPNSDGGIAITGYTVTASNGGTCTTNGLTSCTISNFNANAYYTFTVTATNAVGISTASSASASVGVAIVTPPAAPVAPTPPPLDPNVISTPSPKNDEITAGTSQWSFSVKTADQTGKPQQLVKSKLTAKVGYITTFNGVGFLPNSKILIYMHSEPVYVGEVQVSAEGKVSGQISLELAIEPGQHNLVFKATMFDGSPYEIKFPIEIINSPTVVKSPAKSVYFAGDSSALTLAAKTILDTIVKSAINKRNLIVQVNGFVKKTPVSRFDKTLSMARAAAVTKYLKSKGLKATYNAAGKGYLSIDNASARRATISVSFTN